MPNTKNSVQKPIEYSIDAVVIVAAILSCNDPHRSSEAVASDACELFESCALEVKKRQAPPDSNLSQRVSYWDGIRQISGQKRRDRATAGFEKLIAGNWKVVPGFDRLPPRSGSDISRNNVDGEVLVDEVEVTLEDMGLPPPFERSLTERLASYFERVKVEGFSKADVEDLLALKPAKKSPKV